MFIAKTPLRISFFGGGTDYPEWFNSYGGQVISTTIDKYSFISLRILPSFFKEKYRIAYSKIELVNKIQDIKHPAVRAAFKHCKLEKGMELTYSSDMPSNSGVGSSSNFIVGILKAIYELKKIKINSFELAKKSIFLERNLIKDHVGFQDQIICAYGGFKNIIFKNKNNFFVKDLNLKTSREKELNSNLMLFFTGIRRNSNNLAKEHKNNIEKNYYQLQKINEMVIEAKSILKSSCNLDIFGKLLNESWLIKKTLTKNTSNKFINQIYRTAIKNGALGGKLLGAGGGGFILFYVPKENQKKVLKSLNRLLYFPFKFDKKGSTVIFKP